MAAKSEARRASLLDALRSADAPVSGGQLANTLNVSRQIIVQDIALLREAGLTSRPISSVPRKWAALGHFKAFP